MESDVRGRTLLCCCVYLVLGAAMFVLTRQPYAGILCLAILVIKGALILKRKKV